MRLDAGRIDPRRIDVAEQRDALRGVFAGSPGPPKLPMTPALGCFPDYRRSDLPLRVSKRVVAAGTRR